MIPEKVGLKAVMRDGIDYEFTIVLDINMKHQAIASRIEQVYSWVNQILLLHPLLGK